MKRHWMIPSAMTVLVSVLGVGLGSLSSPVSCSASDIAGEPHSSWNFSDAGMIPMQSGGRVKPLDTFAREIMLFQTGSRFYPGWNPVDLVFSFLTAPQVWESRSFITVGREDVRRQIGLDEKRILFTPKELFAESFLIQYAR